MLGRTTNNHELDEYPRLDNYVLTEKLGESMQAQVYKGFHKHVPEYPLVIKYLISLTSWEDQSRYLRQKIERLKVLHDPRACTPLALESCGNQHFLVQPWFNGIPLNQWTKQQQDIQLDDFFTIACTLADTLQSVHDAGITHGGVKPHNILIQPNTLTIRLTDFITLWIFAMSAISFMIRILFAIRSPIHRQNKPDASTIGLIFLRICIR